MSSVLIQREDSEAKSARVSQPPVLRQNGFGVQAKPVVRHEILVTLLQIPEEGLCYGAKLRDVSIPGLQITAGSLVHYTAVSVRQIDQRDAGVEPVVVPHRHFPLLLEFDLQSSDSCSVVSESALHRQQGIFCWGLILTQGRPPPPPLALDRRLALLSHVSLQVHRSQLRRFQTFPVSPLSSLVTL